ncbi:MAG TPA: hypothetical protein VMR70_11455 [Flavisolibacter sp.]|nr:hypothetical protein [Flavisolibacter sp.]
MEFKKIEGSIYYTPAERDLINHLRPHAAAQWQGKLPGKRWGARTQRDNFKKKIKVALEDLQGEFCCFCGLELGETSAAQIEHIAPKGDYPQFMFINNNLALACSLCNGFEKKGEIETIEIYNDDYEQCTFLIVHPYRDDPWEHFEVVDYDKGDIIFRYLTPQAERSRDIFDLDGPKQIRARGKHFMHRELSTHKQTEDLLKEILKNKYTRKK